jgi:hypothetical protein
MEGALDLKARHRAVAAGSSKSRLLRSLGSASTMRHLSDTRVVADSGHVGTSERSFGKRTRLSAAAKVKAKPRRPRPRNRVFYWPATVLIQPNASSMRLRMRCVRRQHL